MPRIADIPHLERRPSGFFWRRRLPRAMLRHDATEFFLVVSLRTHVPSDAKSRAGRLTALSDTVFAWATETGMIDPDLATRLLKALARFEIEADEAARAVAPPRSQADVEMALARESAVQETLRRALMLNDREVARAPLRAVATRLGVALEEDDDDWKRLAWRATRVLLEASEERARRETGSYGAETGIVRDVLAGATGITMPGSAPAGATTPAAIAPVAATARPAVSTVAREMTGRAPVSVSALVTEPPAVVPAGLRAPDGMSPEQAEAARIAARPPKITIDRRKLSEASRAALDKPRGITLPEALRLYRELKCLGYANAFATEQQPTAEAGADWLRNNREKPDVAERFWPGLLGDGPLEEIPSLAVGMISARRRGST